jgi:hypothetical protein
MFELFGGPPVGWEPIPDEVLAELPPPADAPEGMVPFLESADDLVWEAVGRSLGVDTLPLITAAGFDGLSVEAGSCALRRLEELTAHLEAVKAKLTAVIAGPAPVSEAARRDDFSAHEVGVATRSSVYAADRRIGLARDLAGRLTASAVALEQGRLSYPQALALSEATGHLDVEVAQEIEANLLKFSHRQHLGLFRNSLRRWLERLDPGFTRRAKADRADAVVAHTALGDGVGELYLRGPLEITSQLDLALTAHAAKTKPELGGTAAQRKLAALRDMVEQYLDAPGAARRHGRLPILNITIDLPTLLNLRAGVAEIPGLGAIPADAARWLIGDGAPLRRLIIDPANGQLLDHATTSHTATAALADYLTAKNITSAAPHSTIPAAGCDIEHNTPHPQGPTNRTNCTPIDRRWHRAKTHAGWTYTKNTDTGVVTWTSPTSGLTCDIDPHDYRPVPSS